MTNYPISSSNISIYSKSNKFIFKPDCPGGISYRFLEGFSAFANYGYISKAPIFDNVIDDGDGIVATNPDNELFNAFEIGLTYISPAKDIDVNVNYYNTNWQDRANKRSVVNQDGSEDIIYLKGMDQLHKGFEIEANYQPFSFVGVGAALSFANWEYTSDVSGTYRDYSSGSAVDETFDYYVKGLKVGDAPQTQYAFMLTLIPIKDLRLQFDYRHYKNHYAAYEPTSRTDATDREQVWMAPSYDLFDMHFSYKLPIKSEKLGVNVFAHIFNLLDEMYIQDATDESRFNAVGSAAPHSAMRAEVYLGLPRTYNVGVKINF